MDVFGNNVSFRSHFEFNLNSNYAGIISIG